MKRGWPCTCKQLKGAPVSSEARTGPAKPPTRGNMHLPTVERRGSWHIGLCRCMNRLIKGKGGLAARYNCYSRKTPESICKRQGVFCLHGSKSGDAYTSWEQATKTARFLSARLQQLVPSWCPLSPSAHTTVHIVVNAIHIATKMFPTDARQPGNYSCEGGGCCSCLAHTHLPTPSPESPTPTAPTYLQPGLPAPRSCDGLPSC